VPLSWMSQADVTVSSGNPVGGWIKTKGARIVNVVLYCTDPSNMAHMIVEVAEELDGAGNALHSEILEKGADFAAGPGEQKTFTLRQCPHGFMRLSASGDSPSFPATLVRGGIEVIH
jgi:hypothetical protein